MKEKALKQAEQIKGLVEELPGTNKQVRLNLGDFAEFLENLSKTVK